MANEQNLVPFTGADDPRRSNGKPKGIKNWSTIVRNLLADEKFVDKVYSRKPEWWGRLPHKNGANAVAAAMMVKALKGDKFAADWLRQTGFGDKLIHGLDDDLFKEAQLTIKVVKSDNFDSKRETASSEDAIK